MMNLIQCQNCGQNNNTGSQFCRFCGTKFLVQQPMAQDNYDFQAPRPYSWKTDEYQTQSEPRTAKQAERVQPLNDPRMAAQNYGAQPLAYRAPQQFAGNYRCPNCMSQFLPRTERRISTAGWITFAVLLVFFFPLFWIGLLIKEDVHVCPSCNIQIK
jgi:hypothetical protein